ncbi:MAG: hypothetical protein K0Q50_200 [Vampirovibrio sp.]|jgi:hypothetical protein|nr:hypothetical protein [Vampirovibrio sp.]
MNERQKAHADLMAALLELSQANNELEKAVDDYIRWMSGSQ